MLAHGGNYMKLAYMMLAHKGKEQIMLLIESMSDENVDIYIHIDAKTNELHRSLVNECKSFVNVYIIENRIAGNWSGFSLVEATLVLMREASKKHYDYVSLISGQDFLIKNIKYIKKFLTDNYGNQYITWQDIGKHYWRLKCFNFFSESISNRKFHIRMIDNAVRQFQKLFMIRRKNLKNLSLYKGSQWFTITFEAAQYVLEYIEKNPCFMNDYKYTSCADESFIQIILLNSKFRANLVNKNLVYLDWENSKKKSPKILTLDDFTNLNNSDNLFARKFDLDVDKQVLYYIKENLI